MTHQLSHGVAADIYDEHRHLGQLLEQIRAALSARQVQHATVATYFYDLRDQIELHFAHEEDGGFFHDELLEAPWLQVRANGLLEQHPQFMDTLHNLCSIAEHEDDTSAWWVEIATQFNDFMQRFSEHEQAENTLMQDALNRDVGAED